MKLGQLVYDVDAGDQSTRTAVQRTKRCTDSHSVLTSQPRTRVCHGRMLRRSQCQLQRPTLRGRRGRYLHGTQVQQRRTERTARLSPINVNLSSETRDGAAALISNRIGTYLSYYVAHRALHCVQAGVGALMCSITPSTAYLHALMLRC